VIEPLGVALLTTATGTIIDWVLREFPTAGVDRTIGVADGVVGSDSDAASVGRDNPAQRTPDTSHAARRPESVIILISPASGGDYLHPLHKSGRTG
jgi:hypothetical protein